MIIELPNYVDQSVLNKIRSKVKPFIKSQSSHCFNRDGSTVDITKTKELKEVDELLYNIFQSVQENIIQQRFNPMGASCDTGYEYHRYSPGEICHHHSDGELSSAVNKGSVLLRYASIILHLNTVKHGGELVFPAQDRVVKTEAGKIVCFPPSGVFSHYTKPSKETREVIVTWFVYNDYQISKRI